MQKTPLLDQVRNVCRVRLYSPHNEKVSILETLVGCVAFSLPLRAARLLAATTV